MKGRGDVPLRPSCAVITLRHRRFPSHRKSRIYFSVPNLRIISSHGRSRMSTGCLCHEICEFFFFTRKVTDVHGRFMSRDLRIFLFHTASHGCQRKSRERKVRDLPRDIPCEKKKRRPNILFLFTTTKVRK